MKQEEEMETAQVRDPAVKLEPMGVVDVAEASGSTTADARATIFEVKTRLPAQRFFIRGTGSSCATIFGVKTRLPAQRVLGQIGSAKGI